MIFFKKRVTDQPLNEDLQSADLKRTAENLYKQNHELAVKNKTLSLLSKLYEISILTLTANDLASRISHAVQVGLSFELVGLLLYNEDKKELQPLAFTQSDFLNQVQKSYGVHFSDVAIPKISSNLLSKIIDTKKSGQSETLEDVWGPSIPKEMFSEIGSRGHVKSSVAYPLLIEGRVIGVLLLGLNRMYSDLVVYEKESIESFINVVAVALDKALLSEQLKTTNNELEISNNKLKDLDKQKTEFVSFASHQLRSPLTAMKGYASLILEGDYGPISDDLKKAAQIIFESTKTLAVVVDDYLNVSRIELGQMKYDFTVFDLKNLVQDVVDELKPNVEKAGLKLTFTADEHDPKSAGADFNIKGDKEKLKQVITNIIDNSVKYTPKGEVAIALSHVSKKTIRISIKDTGIGIAADVIPKLFSKFSRAANANKTNIRGTGLGLFIAKEIMNAHKGKIWVESEGDGKGSQFYIEVPVD